MQTDSGFERALRTSALIAGAVALVSGLLVFVVGWGLDVGPLRGGLLNGSTMKPNTAAGFLALGLALLLAQFRAAPRALAYGAAAVALAIGLVTLAEFVFEWNAGIDQLLIVDRYSARLPGRPAAATALILTLLGAALACLGHPPLRRLKAAPALGAMLIAWIALNGYLLGAQALGSVSYFTSLSLPTAVLSLLLSAGILATAPVSWPLTIAFAPGTSGIVCRALLPFAVLAPPLLGWLLNREGSGATPDEFRWALYSVCSSTGSAGLIILLAHRIAIIDAERALATRLSRHDSLTDLANRRAFDAFLLENFRLALRHRHPLSLLLLDVDKFKDYNDTFGHPAGDEVLKALGMQLQALARSTDFVARIGGEEFAVVLPETDLHGAAILAERMRTTVAQLPSQGRPVTVSIGVASLTEAVANPPALVRDCDAALYAAKRAGRNRVVCAGLAT